MTAPKILAFAGSTRTESWNKKLIKIGVEGARAAGAEVTLAMSAARDTPLRVSVNGHALGEGTVGPERTRLRFLVPAQALFRGDNLLTLETADAATAARLYAIAYSPIPRSP